MSPSPSPAPDPHSVPDVLIQVLEILQDTSDDLAPCGAPVLAQLSSLHALLSTALDSPSTPACSAAQTLAGTLLDTANHELNAVPYSRVQAHWRRLYTDAGLLLVLARLADPDADENRREDHARESVRLLDMALIVAGAPGEGRTELVFVLLELAQDRLRAAAGTATDGEPPLKKRRRGSSPPPSPSRSPRPAAPAPGPTRAPLPPPYLHRPLPCLSSLPSSLTPNPSAVPPFSASPSHAHNAPFVIRRAYSSSTACERWGDPAYLREKAGPGRVVPVEVGGDYTAEGWGQRVMPFDEFLEALSPPSPESSSSPAAPPPVFYLAQHSLFHQLPTLLADLPLPALSDPAVRPQTDGSGVRYSGAGATTADGRVVNAWLGPRGTKSAAHTDPGWNCYIQVTGSKWVWVAPPSLTSADMGAFGSSSAPSPSVPADAAEEKPTVSKNDKTTSSAAAHEYMTNTSALDVTVAPPFPPVPYPPSSSSPADASHPDSEKRDGPPEEEKEEQEGYYPRAWLDKVEPLARQAVLEAGDVLVLPPRWWHAMLSLEPSFSVSVWF
ncbi:hypothetical protein JCM10207_003297 [Rhodosporidiobolus poonsookiae]